jgi:high affinity Mn2+ porin
MAYTDTNYSISLGLSSNGDAWHRAGDTLGIAGAVTGISGENQQFLEAGGTGLADGDGALNYGWEKVMETYYSLQIVSALHLTFDYQFVADPAFNRDRGPVSIVAARIHWQF